MAEISIPEAIQMSPRAMSLLDAPFHIHGIAFLLAANQRINHSSAMKAIFPLMLLLAWLLLPASAQTSMLDMRKKVQKAKVQRTKTYVQAVDDALAQNDIPAAERALTAAIAQGTLTQAQINDARGSIQSKSSSLSTARIAQENAKREQEQAAVASTQPAPSRPSGAAPAAGKFHTVIIAFKNGGPWYQTARVFNVDASGKESRSPTPNSPGECRQNLKLASDDTTVSHDCAISGVSTDGTYGYEVSFATVDKDPLGLMGGNKVLSRSGPYSGTFTVPQGCYQVTMAWSGAYKKFDIFTHK